MRGTAHQMAKIIEFVKSANPDIIGLIEVDMGSVRSGRINQAEAIAAATGLIPAYKNKYAQHSINQYLPVVRKQGNAFLTRQADAIQRFHYFDLGIKRLIIELEMRELCLFLVHLSLKYRHRHRQMHELVSLVRGACKPVIVAGDFNTLWGSDEIDMFAAAASLNSVNVRNLPSWPSTHATRQLDFILHSKGVSARHFSIPEVALSDHLPLVFDFEIDAQS